MIAFLLAVLLLFVVTAALLLAPLLRPVRPGHAEHVRREATLLVLRDQLADLEQEKATGSLSDAEFETGAEDLKRRILEETRAEPPGGEAPENADRDSRGKPGVVVPFFVLAALLLGSVSGYLVLGRPAALDPAARATAPAENAPMDPAQVDAMIARLTARLKENPGDAEGWITLGRTYKALDRPAEAAEAFSHAEARMEKDPDLLIGYAETLAATQGNLSGKPGALVGKALALDPDHVQGLFLAGVAAYENGDKKKAADYWEKLLPHAQRTDAATHDLLRKKIAELRAETGAGKKGGGSKEK
ncbi:MAG: c-type cytochrome biogenesis protein CcmI [Zoogloeaceae bacterium]|jgi:cytochrome c-type biogenesis protein CcmH|nr:c-type cytochrome biogenesis protein CcmI [Zoogloeaceae bacterium]